MKTLVLGMGNPILSDDGVGLFIARSLNGELEGVDVIAADVSGLNLLDLIQGYDQLFVIDALINEGSAFGILKKLPKGEGGCHFFSSHGLGFFEMMEFGKALGFKIPEISSVYGIEIGKEVAFGRELSSGLLQRTEEIRRIILEDIKARLRHGDEKGCEAPLCSTAISRR
jgi:hydrogenase maturation protease